MSLSVFYHCIWTRRYGSGLPSDSFTTTSCRHFPGRFSRPWRLVVGIFPNRPSLMRNTTRNSHHKSARHHFVKLVCNVSVVCSFTLLTPAWFTRDNIHEHKFQPETNDWRPLFFEHSLALIIHTRIEKSSYMWVCNFSGPSEAIGSW